MISAERFDGKGERVGLTSLVAALKLLDQLPSAQIERPSIFADADGGVRLEWLTPSSHTVIVVDDVPSFRAYHLDVQNSFEEARDNLGDVDSAILFLSQFLARARENDGLSLDDLANLIIEVVLIDVTDTEHQWKVAHNAFMRGLELVPDQVKSEAYSLAHYRATR
jgi:hypothetical protein